MKTGDTGTESEVTMGGQPACVHLSLLRTVVQAGSSAQAHSHCMDRDACDGARGLLSFTHGIAGGGTSGQNYFAHICILNP